MYSKNSFESKNTYNMYCPPPNFKARSGPKMNTGLNTKGLIIDPIAK
jgi:hypothetical protein